MPNVTRGAEHQGSIPTSYTRVIGLWSLIYYINVDRRNFSLNWNPIDGNGNNPSMQVACCHLSGFVIANHFQGRIFSETPCEWSRDLRRSILQDSPCFRMDGEWFMLFLWLGNQLSLYWHLLLYVEVDVEYIDYTCVYKHSYNIYTYICVYKHLYNIYVHVYVSVWKHLYNKYMCLCLYKTSI